MSGWTHNYLVFRLWFCRRRLLPFINLPAATEWGSRNGNYDLTAGITTAALHGEEEGGRRVDDCGKYFIYNPHVGKYPKEQQSIIIWEEGNTITCNDSDYCRRRRRETMGVIKWRQELLSLLYWCLMAGGSRRRRRSPPSIQDYNFRPNLFTVSPILHPPTHHLLVFLFRLLPSIFSPHPYFLPFLWHHRKCWFWILF